MVQCILEENMCCRECLRFGEVSSEIAVADAVLPEAIDPERNDGLCAGEKEEAASGRQLGAGIKTWERLMRED